LSEGRWTHDYPLTVEEAQRLGLPVRTGLLAEIYDLMRLYPQPPQRRPSVEYIPGRTIQSTGMRESYPHDRRHGAELGICPEGATEIGRG
jgi:ClpP class serine protease